jgi:hypothetical protein
LGQRPPGPGRDRAGALAAGIRLRLDEIGVVGVVAHPVPHEAQPAEGPLDEPALGRVVAGQGGVVAVRVVSHQGGVDHGDPPHSLADGREGVRLVQAPGPEQPVDRVPHGRDGPPERARLGRRIADVPTVPRDPAPGRAEPGVLAARHEQGAALLAFPGVDHHTHHVPCYA